MKAFKAYDVRNIYPEIINEELFKNIGNSLKVLGDVKTIIIGHDMRNSSVPLKNAIIKGATDIGINVIDIGLCTTPMLYQATHDYKIDIGLMVTASHNSKEYNGVKLTRKNAIPIAYTSGLQDLEKVVENIKYEKLKTKGKVTVIEDYLDRYISMLKPLLNPKSKLKVVMDSGNGIGSLDAIDILQDKVDLIKQYTELDGTFPHHLADPYKEENMEDLKRRVIKEKADLGIAFDGDADRFGIVDDTGKYINCDILLAFLIHHMILEYPEEKRYNYDLTCSKIIEDTILENGKIPLKTKVGHSAVKEAMRKHQSFFGGEISGHFYYRHQEDLVYDSGIKTAIILINAITKYDKPISELLKKYQKYYHSEPISFKTEDKQGVLDLFKNKFSNLKQDYLDGVSIIADDWWCNIRPSNTEDIVKLTYETNTKKLYNEKLKLFKELIENYN